MWQWLSKAFELGCFANLSERGSRCVARFEEPETWEEDGHERAQWASMWVSDLMCYPPQRVCMSLPFCWQTSYDVIAHVDSRANHALERSATNVWRSALQHAAPCCADSASRCNKITAKQGFTSSKASIRSPPHADAVRSVCNPAARRSTTTRAPSLWGWSTTTASS